MNLNDKKAWCQEYGDKVENEFCVSRLYELGISGYMNPEKRENKYVHDIFAIFKADLKTVRTPFFMAQEKYGIDSQYAVTFNLKDGERYKKLYPNIIVVFDVLWDKYNCEKVINGKKYEVVPMHKTYAGFLEDIKNAIISCGKKTVEYQGRINDTNGNAKISFVFDVRKLQLLSDK